VSEKRELPVVGLPRAERADAARNRRKILAAAARIIAARGVDALSMDEVAQAAGVGVGTVYRRFGDRAALIYALIDEREREFQGAFIQGPPPLGPGAPPAERIGAFLAALADRTEAQPDLLLTAETDSAGARFGGAYGVYRAHLSALIAEARPDADADYLADALLAPLAADLYLHQRRVLGMSAERVKAGLAALAAALPDPRP
jgi:AcrR family transcriptional regulator